MRLDLPALTGPARATVTPSRQQRVRSNPASREATAAFTSAMAERKPSCGRHSTSSSGKSTARQICARRCSTRSRRSPMRCPSTPSSLAAASLVPSLDGAAIISATASACVRSILPLRKARRVNSPRSARRAPARRHASSTAASRTGPPWHWSSATSSPVKVLGPGMNTASESSSVLPSVS